MAFYSGSANDMAAVRTALVDACVTEGWSWNSGTEVLSKGAMFLRLQIVSGYLTLLGRTSAGAGDAPSIVRMGQMGTAITWPVEYTFFVFDAEVYCVIKFGVDFYLWCAFGQSTVAGLPGTGMWVAASVHAIANHNPAISPIDGPKSSFSYGCAAIFWRTSAGAVAGGHDYWVHSDLDDQGWWSGQSVGAAPAGIQPAVPLIGVLPNSWNSEAVLLPIRAYKFRPSNRLSLTADLEHARYTRVDNYSPGEVIQIGDERWMVLPFYRKDSANRNGSSQPAAHTGTFGWAIRYEGP
ncbi:hypothetical protein [Ectopseudomonas oleovorans]|uniref:Uncharacterized protein n=1 Tax=Ectopseudomonas oleovorans (strain CECT 5344) TaxID=1182590 RepID=W6R0Z8_ECTO5|nr:hypothetical protein [Pseudomonas oleovorans]CDM42382.1 hypothetical protein BN5_3840 [Pseudomonas oleovorans CECT 5344]CDR93005.1 hypothetical protein PPSAL_3781 [Pseudomonas oleovorans]